MTAWSDAVASLSPYLWWKLDETSGSNATDSSGNGFTGTYSSATLNQTGLIPGDSGGKSINLATTSGNVSKGSGLSFPNVGVTYAVTFKSSTDVAAGRFFQAGGTTNLTFGSTTCTANIITGVSPSLAYDPSGLSDGNAHLVVYVVRATTVELWVDGTMVASASHSASNTNQTAFTLKQSFGSPVGNYDDALIFSSALSTTQIADLQTAWSGSVPAATVTLGATLRSKTAAFTAAVIVAGTLTGTLQAKTAAFTVDVPSAPDRTVSLSATLPQKTAAVTVLTAGEATLGATMRAKTAAFTVLGGGSLALAAELQPKTAAFSVESGKTVTLTGALRRKTSAITFVSQPAVRLAATMRAKTATFTVTTLPTVVLAGTLQPKIATFVVRPVTPVTPAPPSVAEAIAVVVASAHGPVTMVGTQPVFSASTADIPRARQQIVVDGVDVTYFRDVPTPDVTYTLLEPLLYGPGQLDLPQIAACFENEGEGDLWWLRAQAPVEVNLVLDDVVVGTVWKGFVAAFDKSGRALSVELGGEANGRAAMRDRQVPIFPRINDLGHQLADAVRDLGLPHYPPLGAVTGIETMTTGGTGHLDHINGLHAKAWTRSGRQWSVMPDVATGVYETHRKDDSAIHATTFLDDEQTKATLRRDISEEPNQIFVTCVTPAGMRVRFGKYPGLIQGPVPDFPGSMAEGDSGEGVRLLIGKLHASGYLKLTEVAGGFDEDVTKAVEALQDDAGLPETGVVNLATWEALYDLNVTGLSLEWANIQPAAQRSKTRKFNRSANGTITGFNDEYDPEVIVRHRTIDLGSGVTRSQAREFARTVLHDSDAPNWVGDIKFNTGALLSGEHAIGATVTAADVMDARLLRPGMNVWLPAFDGGTLLHVSACQVDGDGIVTATVDTRFRDAMEVWEVIARNKESRNDPSRKRNRKHRASTIVKDSIGEWDEIGGLLGVDINLERGWNVFPVVAAMEGQIRKLRILLDTPAEFACAVFGRQIGAGTLNDLIPQPLTVSGTKLWQTKRDALDDHWFLYSAGTHAEPGGYWPGRKKYESETGDEPNPAYDPNADENTTGTDDDETITVTTAESSGTLTGKHVDDAGFPYYSEDRTAVWVAIWVRSSNKIEAGRLMWPQLEAGV